MTFAEMLRILAGRAWIVALVGLSIAGIAAGWTFMQPRLYAADALVLVDLQRADAVNGVRLDRMLVAGFVRTQIDLIRSPATALAVVDRLALAEGPQIRSEFLAATGGRGSIREWVAGLLLRNVYVTPRKGSAVLTISYFGRSPAFSARVATAFAEAYVEANAGLRAKPAERAEDWLAADERARRDVLAASERSLALAQTRNGLTAVQAELDIETRRLDHLGRTLTAAAALAADREAAASLAREFVAGGRGLDPLPAVLADKGVDALRRLRSRTAAEAEALADKLGPHHPQRIAIAERLAAVDARLRAEMAAAVAGLEQEAARSRAVETALLAELDAQRTRVLSMQSARARLAVDLAEVEADRRSLATGSTRRAEALTEAAVRQGNATLLAAALEPTRAASPRTARTIGLGIAAGLMLGVVAALQLELASRRVRGPAALGVDGATFVLRLPRARRAAA